MAFDLSQYDTAIRFLHILSGIIWIGMLYFFNLVNLPLLKFQLKKPYEANMAEKVTGPIAVKTLFWFRWGSLFTVLFGALLLESQRKSMGTMHVYFFERGMPGYAILLGVCLALVMAFNVWFIIWPRQQKILTNNKTIAASTDEAQKKSLADANAPMVKTATFASRLNTWFSIPMLWGMTFGAHGWYEGTEFADWRVPIVILLAVMALAAIYAQAPKKKQA